MHGREPLVMTVGDVVVTTDEDTALRPFIAEGSLYLLGAPVGLRRPEASRLHFLLSVSDAAPLEELHHRPAVLALDLRHTRPRHARLTYPFRELCEGRLRIGPRAGNKTAQFREPGRSVAFTPSCTGCVMRSRWGL